MDLDRVKKMDLPPKPGCYFFHNREGEVIYIGKAANLRSRVLSYWQKSADHTPAKNGMIQKVDRIDWMEVESEIEALLLEANLIKKHQPHFNVVMRDDKRFAYIKVSTEDEIPGVFMTRKITRSGRFFGPFTSVTAIKEVLKVLRKIWPYCTERKSKNKPCFYYQINRCPGICAGVISREEYMRQSINPILLFLEGKKEKVIQDTEKEINRLEKQLKKQKGDSQEYEELASDIDKKKRRLAHMNEILKHTRIISIAEKYAADVVELAKVLGLPRPPERIEGYDISNIFGREAVGSMVVFAGGEPDKNEYRKFKIKNEESKGDVAMLREVLERRFKRMNSEESEKWPRPDLIILDGGKAQLNTATKILKKHSLDIPILAVSKGEKLRSSRAPDKIFFPGRKEPLKLPLASPALHIIKRVRDEAHRFAIEYHRKRKRKTLK